MPVYEVFALRYATHQRPASANLLYPPEGGDPHDGPMPIDYFVWVIRDAGAFSDEVDTGSSKKMRHNQKGGTLRDCNAIVKRSSRVVLVDTGFDWPACAAYGRTMVRHPLEGLRRLGVDPSEVRDVIVTHLHYDHAGNLPAFPNATFHLQDAEMAYATGRCMCHARLRGAFAVEDVCAMVRKVYEGRVAFVDGDGEVAPGITVHAVPGHTRGLQCVRVETERGPVVLASDAAHFYANLAQQNPFPIVVDVAAMMESWRRLARLAGDPERIVPGHEPLVMARYPRHPDMEIEAVLLHRSPTGSAS